MKKFLLLVLCPIFLMINVTTSFAAEFKWPNGEKAAISLSYDDALNSQLDNAVPTLNTYNIKVSFYLMLASEALSPRLDEWRALATQGHELGNHTIYHPCSASRPNRDWVQPHADMDKRTVEHMQAEIAVANAFLKALDGKTERTYTPPCGDLNTKDGNYIPAVRSTFVAIKGDDANLPSGFSSYILPNGQSGKELISLVENAAKNGGLVNVIFHGIGGDHLSVSTEAHGELIKYLAENRKTYWTDSYINIMKYVDKAMVRN